MPKLVAEAIPKHNIWMQFIALVVALAILLPAILVAIGVRTFDAEASRDVIARNLSYRLGREVKLEGPITLSFSPWRGITIIANDVLLTNPIWASRSYLAKIGHVELGVNFLPLLHNQIIVNSFDLFDADVKLENTPSGENNLPARKSILISEEVDAASPDNKNISAPVVIHVDKVNMGNSPIEIRHSDGKTTSLLVHSLGFSHVDKDAAIDLYGEIANIPFEAHITSDPLEKMLTTEWQFKIQATYANYNLLAHGNVNDANKTLSIGYYQLTSGKSVATGEAKITYDGKKPWVVGKFESNHLNYEDLRFRPTDHLGIALPGYEDHNAMPKYYFAEQAINFDVLRNIEGKFNLDVGEIQLGAHKISKAEGVVDLVNGNLLLSPLTFSYADSPAQLLFKINASSIPPQLALQIKARQLDLTQILKLGGLEAFLIGKADIDTNIASMGNSPHEFAANANGWANLVMAGGEVTSQITNQLTEGVLGSLAPSLARMANSNVNCLAARFRIKQGLAIADGLLFDASEFSVGGRGGVDFRNENINIYLQSKSKGLALANVIPSTQISGTLLQPKLNADTQGGLAKATGVFAGAGDVAAIPDMQIIKGQNACAYTLEHGKQMPAQAGDKKGIVQDLANQAQGALGGVGNTGLKILQELGGSLSDQ